MRRVIAALLLGSASLALSACGSSAGAGTEASGTPTTQGSAFSGEGCTSGPAEANVRVTIYGGESCAQWDRTASSQGTYWREVPFPASNELQIVCSMEGPGSNTLIEVRDTGEHSDADAICAGLTSEGWHDAEGPGVENEQSRREQEANEKANAERAAQEAHEAERPGLEAAAAKLKSEAASARGRQHHEEALAKDDEAEAEHIENVDASAAESAGNYDEADTIREHADGVRKRADGHRGDADTAEGEANAKEHEAEEQLEEARG